MVSIHLHKHIAWHRYLEFTLYNLFNMQYLNMYSKFSLLSRGKEDKSEACVQLQRRQFDGANGLNKNAQSSTLSWQESVL